MTILKRNPLIVFFVLAYLLPWLVWGTTIGEQRGLLSFHIPQSLAFWLGLTLASYGAAALTGGWPAVKDLLIRLIRWRVNLVWYLVALAATGALAAAAIGVHLLLGGTHQVGVLLTLNGLLPSLLFQIFFFLITEETAWRGFALPRLQARFSALNASLILGVLWGLWHLPLVLIAGSFQARVPFIGFTLSAVATAFIATWLFNHTHGSVLLAAVFHGATDALIAYTNVMTGDLRLFWIFVIILCLAAVAIVVFEGQRQFARRASLSGTVYPDPGH